MNDEDSGRRDRERGREPGDAEWSDGQRRALAALRSESESDPPPGVEGRVVRELTARGLIRAGRPLRVGGDARLLMAAAAAAALFVAGLALGRRVSPPAAPSSPAPRFALFLLDEPPGGAAKEAARVAEYKRWAAGLGAIRLVGGEKLGDAARLLVPAGENAPGSSELPLRGYFVIRAPDMARAIDVARTCPHLKRGGRILVRPIAPV